MGKLNPTRSQTKHRESSEIIKAATAYFALVFSAGFILGPIRILFLVPRFGARMSELMEFPVMLIVIVLAAKWVVRRFRATTRRLSVGFLALLLMIVFEFTAVLWLRGLTLAAYFRDRDLVAGFVYYLMLIVFAVMPYFIAPKLYPDHDSLHR